MADQQSPGESAVGRPGGGARARNSSAFVVNDKSLRDLRNTWRLLTAEVRAFNQELANVAKNSSALGILQQQLGKVGRVSTSSINVSSTGLSTSQMRGSLSLGNVGPTSPVGGVSSSRVAPLPSQGGNGPAGPAEPSGPSDWSRRRVGAVAIGVGAAGTYVSKSMPGITDMDYMANRGAMGMNGGYSGANKNAVRLTLSNMSGARNGADILAGAATAQQQGFSYGTARASSILGGVSSLARVNPLGGVGTAAQAYAGMYSPQANFAMQSMGMGAAIGSGGARQDPRTVARNVLTRIFRGRMPTPQELSEGMQPGAPLYQTLQQFPPETQQAIIAVGMDAANRGRGQNDSIVASQNLMGRAGARLQGALGQRVSGTMQNLLGFGAGATDVAGTGMNIPGVGMGAATVGLGAAGASAVGRTGLSSGGGFLGWKIGEGALNATASKLDLLTGRAAGLGKVGGALTRGLAGNAGMKAAEERGGTPVWVMNWPAGFGGGGGGLLGGRGGGTPPGGGGGSGAPVPPPAGRVGLLGKLRASGGTAANTSMMAGGLSSGIAGAAATAGVAVAALGAGYMAIKAVDATMANHTARHDLNSQSDDLVRTLLTRVQLWGLMGIPAFKSAYDRQIRPMLEAMRAMPAGSNQRAAAADRVAAALGQLTMRYHSQGSRTMQGKVDQVAAVQQARETSVALSMGGGAEPVVNHKSAAAKAGGGGGMPPVLQVAEQYLGMTYVYGGSNPKQHFDCSGLTQYSYKQVGVNLPRTAAEQQRATPVVDPAQARAGDLVTFGHPAHHVALYMGNGQMLAAPHTGDKIKIQPVYQDQTEYHRVGGGGSVSGRIGSPGSKGGGGLMGALKSVGGAVAGAVSGVAAALGLGGGSNAAPAALSGPSGGGAGGGMFVEANPSTDELGAFATAFSGGRTGGAAFGGLTGTGTGNAGGGSVSTGAGSSSTPSAGQVSTGAGGSHYSVLQALKLASSVGFKGQGLYDAVAVMLAESGGNTRSTNYNKDSRHTIDRGLWQMNSYWHSEVKNPYDPLANAQAAYRISNGGSNWSQWSSWSHDHTAQPYIAQVQKAAQAAGYREGSWEIARDQIAKLHKGEMVVPERAAMSLRRAVADPGGRGGGGGVVVHLTVPVQLVGSATKKNVDDFVSQVEDRLQSSQVLRAIGAH